MLAPSTGLLFAFAEARNYSGDDCYPHTSYGGDSGLACLHNSSSPGCRWHQNGPRSLALKTSRTGGASWSSMRIVDWNGINPAAVCEQHRPCDKPDALAPPHGGRHRTPAALHALAARRRGLD